MQICFNISYKRRPVCEIFSTLVPIQELGFGSGLALGLGLDLRPSSIMLYDCRAWSGFRARLLSHSVFRRQKIALLFSHPTRVLLRDLCEFLKKTMIERECALGVL